MLFSGMEMYSTPMKGQGPPPWVVHILSRVRDSLFDGYFSSLFFHLCDSLRGIFTQLLWKERESSLPELYTPFLVYSFPHHLSPSLCDIYLYYNRIDFEGGGDATFLWHFEVECRKGARNVGWVRGNSLEHYFTYFRTRFEETLQPQKAIFILSP